MNSEAFFSVDRSVGYPVRDIMTRPVCWDYSEQSRQALVEECEANGYTFIPVSITNGIEGIITREALKRGDDPTPLSVDWLVAANTPILEVISLFAQRPDHVFLVLESTRVTGIVAPADLNKIPARASLYLLVAHFELELAAFVRSVLGSEDDTYKKYFSEERFQRFCDRRSEATSRDIELDITHYFDLIDFETIIEREERLYGLLGFPFSDEAAQSKNKLRKEIYSRLSVTVVRNPVSHASNLLVTSRDQVQKIDEICDNLIFFHRKITSSGQKTV